MSFRGKSDYLGLGEKRGGNGGIGGGSNLGSNLGANLGPVKRSAGPLLVQFEAFAEKIESMVDTYFSGFKPYVPGMGRFLIVATFYEDALRIFSQWKDQVFYLWNYRHFWYWFVVLFLLTNITVMISASTMLILRKKTEVAASSLALVVFFQGIVYGLWSQSSFLLRNLSVIGGLVLAFADSIVRDRRPIPGLPMIENKDKKKYILLAGRVMIVVLFSGFAFNSSWSIVRFFVVLIGFVSAGSIVVGYKTKFAAIVLVVILALYNVSANHYWSYGYRDSRRDFLKYEFFQTLSIVGGLLLVASTGAGELSLDGKKKIY